MLTYWLRLTPQQSVLLDNPSVIPGRTIRGAIAAVSRRGCILNAIHATGPCTATCGYWPLFGTEAPGAMIRVSDAYATHVDGITQFPYSVRTCRAVPGFLPAGHGVCDTAIRAWVFEQVIPTPDRLLAPHESVCPRCGADWIVWPNDSDKLARGVSGHWETVTTSVSSSSSVHRSESEGLFRQSGTTLPSGAYYVAQVEIPEALEPFLRAALREGILIGGRRTRGSGLMRAELVPRPDPASTIHARIQEFNRLLRVERRFYTIMQNQFAQTAALIDPDEGTWYFILDMTGGQLSAGQVDPLAGVPGLSPVQIIRRWVTSRTVDGYRTATAQRAGTRLLLNGTWLCRVPPEADRISVEQTLAYLETHGLGVNSAHGNGTVVICHPFHLEVEPC